MNKRKDAQGLRGWSVVLVILFQFYPVVFPNSFIGLDIYFVTAGFIVAIILSRYDSFNIDDAKEFLLKRAQRIIPMYYIAMILILLVVGVALPLSYKKLNLDTARKSVFLTANFYNREPGEGFLQLDGEDMNSHLWSLCLELQAYLIIPFAVLLQKRISQNATAFFSGMMVLSMLFHFSTSEPLFHKCVFSRLWQFFAGFLAFSIGDKEMTDLRLKLQDLRYELDDAKFEIRNLRSQLEEAKAENEKFRHAIPKLPTPERLHEMIVAQYQEFYRCTKRIAHLDANIRRTRNSKRSWETRMQELKQHELAHEKTRLEFLLVRAQLRTLMATPALLFCMNSISEEVWEAWMETPQKNDDGKPLLQNYGAIENAITDQLQLLEEYRSNLQTLRAELEGEQQKNTFSFQDEVLEGIKKLQSSMEKTAPEFDFTSLRRILEEQEQKNSIPRQEFMKAVEEIQHCIREALQNAADIHQPKPKQEEMPGLVDDDIINDNIEFMEELDDLEMVDESADEPAQQRNNDLRQQLQDQLQQARQGRNDLVQIIADLRNQKTCQPRRFERDEPVIVNYVKSLGFVVMIFAAVVPIPIDVDSLRLVMTLSTAAILHFNGEDVKMLSNPLMTHIGDMSLVLYLAHVPVYVVVEFYSEYIFCPFPLGILITFMLAIISNQYVECIFFKLSASNVLKISFCLFIATLILSW
ncbi:hypothetical protein Q1695_005042 [Nippostrongylus brasiliensis]|nr:hypothetical protein Q1695_005042 [Nippostrongylus brasiliensis]